MTGKLLQLDLYKEKSYVLSLQWQWSEMPSIFDYWVKCTFRCNRTYTHNLLLSVAFLCSHDTKEKKKSFPSLCVQSQQYYPCAKEGCKDQVSRICLPESLTCPMSKCMILLQCLSILARHRWKNKKPASCIPRRRLEAIHFPHKVRGKKEETFQRLRSFLGQHSHTVLFFILTRKSCLKL